ncbi:hypothetical protein CANCADRAFT_3011 [Tortispora caseinolytica NRRL Y-17796]|uniref:Nop domain-containing protein n=1 Tax=Tortispora caseinolytica NRRL Y-17796 TaxID=767744 RepID=A0A1E4THR2_9ASCO|nr:hypothetical protein CANCADRAFT_3011 [Tortispora caseinolytica NRRL Y-17796]
MSLADELLADFESTEVLDEQTEVLPENIEEIDFRSIKNINNVSKLWDEIQPTLEQVINLKDASNLDHSLVVAANSRIPDIDNEIVLLSKFVQDRYSQRFPDLASLDLTPLDYVKVVAVVGNNLNNIDSDKLEQVLIKSKSIVVLMTAARTDTPPLSAEAWQSIDDACQLVHALDQARDLFVSYVSSKMDLIAPNTSALIGSHAAAQILGVTGGLAALARSPACNLPALGSKRQIGLGFGYTGIRQQGFLYFTPFVQSVPKDYRKQALRIIAAKVSLASRLDLANSDQDGTAGRKMLADAEMRLDKLMKPPGTANVKALPVPEEKKSKRRGGRRFRKFKEQFAMTDVRRAQNRIEFGKPEIELQGAGDESIGLGMLTSEAALKDV